MSMMIEASAFNVVSVVGLAMMLGGLYTSWQAWFAFASRRWPMVVGRVLLAGVYGYDGIPPMYAAHVLYQYNVQGNIFESKRLRFGAASPFSYHAAASELEADLNSGEVRVFYDPENPRRSCLLTGSNEWTLALPTLLLIFGGVLISLGIYRPG